MGVGNWVFPHEPAFRSDDETLRFGIDCLVERAALDCLALLICEFRIWMSLVDLDSAKEYSEGTFRCLANLKDKWCLPSSVYGTCFCWSNTAPCWVIGLDQNASSLSFRRPDTAVMQRPTELSAQLTYRTLPIDDPLAPKAIPILPGTAATRWFEAHREVIRDD